MTPPQEGVGASDASTPAAVPGRVRTFARGLHHPEGVAAAPDGSLVCGSDDGRLLRVSADGEVAELARLPGALLLGIAVLSDGSVAACDLTGNRLVLVGSGREADLPAPEGGWRHPNFPLRLPDDTLLVTDSGRWGRDDGRIVHVLPGRGTAEVLARGLAFANGLALLPDGAVALIESSSPALSVWRRDDGRLERLDTIALPAGVSDGVLALADGSLLVACYRPDSVLHVRDGEVAAIASDPTGLRLAAPTNLAPLPGFADRVVIACFGGYHLAEIEPPAPALTPW